MMTPNKPVYTPWGKAHDTRTYAEGIVFYSTSSHGGFKLDRARNAQVPAVLREPSGWYEEDCAWAKVAYVFPDVFPEKERECATQTLKRWYPDEYEALTGTILAPGESYAKDERCFFETHAQDWIVTSAITSKQHPGMVECVVRIGGVRNDKPERRYLVTEEEYQNRAPFGFVINESRHALYDGPSSFVVFQTSTNTGR